MNEQDAAFEPESAPPRELSKSQRRVLGVLIEKGLTTPDQYPLTLKSLTTGCNQKSNRSPVTNYSEDAVEETVDELRQMGLAAVVHTGGGRTERFRHYARKRFPFSEVQLAVMAELWLRGRQQIGELRSRASRMCSIDSLDDLRSQLADLQSRGFVQADGPLERRGVSVDHAFYASSEAVRMASEPDEVEAKPGIGETGVNRPASAPPEVGSDELADVQASIDELRTAQRELASEMQSAIERIREIAEEVSDLRTQLGA
ncbi:MAG: DUF480 domain-containing protein [Planctomycetota bacterium]|nr:MAG: DUF480 domain-containing protein [Planctomycetota bacterium]REJ88886.1 MAG: DUF480 domain-containing protein [Planctomycetota bacterium]REK21302.1 MAG: DUF480 domain-containing protein [Planctomycetota bacterium]REK32098.1 MAG: DUF480 domain-containing protein [Planctomycetota bacterium]